MQEKKSQAAHQFDSIEETVQAFREGQFIVVLDSTDRENEGDLIIAAEAMTTEKMAFMIRHTSGLICAPMTSQYTEKLALPQMVAENTESHRTAFTVSIDAQDPSVSTGISAHDRALTSRMLAAPSTTAASFSRPGHIFPLQAKEGGVKVRTGHTEATVDFCRLAGMKEVGIICELVDDGEAVEGRTERIGGGMVRRDACLTFGRKWGLKVCTIEDLVEYLDKKETNGVSGVKVNGFH